MNIIVILFVLALIFISTAGREFEDTAYNEWFAIRESRNEGLSFEEGMKKIDSLWTVWQEMK